ncbi:MAG: carbon-nitrogen hydrolase family protein [Armatimonadota bacterium]
MPLPIHVAVLQYSLHPGELVRAASQDRALHLMDDAAHNADLILLPDYSFREPEDLPRVAESVPGPTTAVVSQIALARSAYICCSIVERDGDRLYNTAVLAGADGNLVGKQRKIHLTRHDLDLGFSGGTSLDVFPTHIGTLGILVCHDAGQPEHVRTLILSGVEMILIPCALHAVHVETVVERWRSVLQKIARAGRCPVALANRIGAPMIGRSMILAPDGTPLAEGSADAEEILYARVTPKSRNLSREE